MFTSKKGIDVVERSLVNVILGCMLLRYLLFKSSMNRLASKANAGAICVPIAVQCRCIKCSLLKTKLFMVKIMQMRSHMDSVGTDRSVRWLRASEELFGRRRFLR